MPPATAARHLLDFAAAEAMLLRFSGLQPAPVKPCRCHHGQLQPALQLRNRTAAAACSADGPAAKWLPCQPNPQAPWNLTFDLRERETDWTEANQARLVALVTAQQLSISMEEMEERLDALMLLLPDLAGKIPKLQPGLLAVLTGDLQATSARLLALRELLPAANISRVVAQRPQVLLQHPGEVAQAVEALQQLLHMERVDKLVEAQPLLLVTPCVQEVLSDMRRLMPGNPEALLAADPDWVLRVQRGQKWLGQNPDSDFGELITWQCPGTASAEEAGS